MNETETNSLLLFNISDCLVNYGRVIEMKSSCNSFARQQKRARRLDVIVLGPPSLPWNWRRYKPAFVLGKRFPLADCCRRFPTQTILKLVPSVSASSTDFMPPAAHFPPLTHNKAEHSREHVIFFFPFPSLFPLRPLRHVSAELLLPGKRLRRTVRWCSAVLSTSH